MARSAGFDEAKIARFHEEARGQGSGADYKPWFNVWDVASRGRSHRILGAVTGRVHHLLSGLERGAFLIYDYLSGVTDIREQFPLDRDATRAIAEQAGILHPVDVRTKTPLVQTTDLVIDLVRNGQIETIARSVKPSSELQKKRAMAKLEIERRYWTDRGVDWGIVTERELPEPVIRNLELLQGCGDLDQLNQPFAGYYAERAVLVASELEAWGDATLQQFCHVMDARLGLDGGGTLLLVRHLLATKVWLADLSHPITDTTQLTAFSRPGDNAARVRA